MSDSRQTRAAAKDGPKVRKVFMFLKVIRKNFDRPYEDCKAENIHYLALFYEKLAAP